MAEFVDTTEETNVELVKIVTKEEIREKNVEAEVGRKRKIGEEEDKKQSSGDGIEEFLSDEAFEVMEKKTLKKGIIRERGFKKFIPPFKDVIEKK